MRRLFAVAFALVAAPAQAGAVGDAAPGAQVTFHGSAACHQCGAVAADRIGSPQGGAFGLRGGSPAGVIAASAQGAHGLDWMRHTPGAALGNPRALVSGASTARRGLRDAAPQAGPPALLRRASGTPQTVPEAPPAAGPAEVDLPPEVLAIVGDVEYGEFLAQSCHSCHQAEGTNAGIPAITGWAVEDFVVAMHAYRQGVRPHPGMQMIAAQLTDEEIAALAAYFAGVGQ